MAITSINSPQIPLSSPDPKTEQKPEDLEESIEKNIKESVDYQIIDKLMIKKEPEDALHKIKNIPDNSNDDKVTLSSTSVSLSETSVETTQSNSSTSSDDNRNVRLDTEQSQQARSASLSFSGEAEDPNIEQTDPLAFDLNGNGIETTGVSSGIEFDIDGDGKKEQTSFISGGDAFLAYDKNGNGLIDNGKELFGDQNGAKNGYEELAKYDDNKDGLIDRNDAIYSDLKLVSVGEDNKLKTSSLSEQKIESIDLGYSNQHQAINYYDSIEQTSKFTRSDGTKGDTADIMLGHKL